MKITIGMDEREVSLLEDLVTDIMIWHPQMSFKNAHQIARALDATFDLDTLNWIPLRHLKEE